MPRSVVLANAHASETVVPNKGGRGIERLRLFWIPNPTAARFQGTSCYINLWPLQGIAIHAHWSHFV